jgi:hypothetical protein
MSNMFFVVTGGFGIERGALIPDSPLVAPNQNKEALLFDYYVAVVDREMMFKTKNEAIDYAIAKLDAMKEP